MTPRERAIAALIELTAKPYGSDVPRSVAATFVNELLSAMSAEIDETLAGLIKARLVHNDQIGRLIRIAELHNLGQALEAEPLIEQLQRERGDG